MKVDLGVERDHIESLTKATGLTALSELIWNSLDADATAVKITFKKNSLGNYEFIQVADNGNGLTYDSAKSVFGKLGGSEKKMTALSPKGRALHGKEGKGRYRALALGDLVKFRSTFRDNNQGFEFEVTLDKNFLTFTEIADPIPIINGAKNGFVVEILNVDSKNADHALSEDNRRELEEKFAAYWTSYPTFTVSIGSKELKFESLIKNTVQTEKLQRVGEVDYKFVVKIIEWTFENKKKTYLCNAKGIPYQESSLGIRSGIPISIFVQSVYIEKLHRDNLLLLNEIDPVVAGILIFAKDFAREYVRKRLHYYSKEFIEELKRKNIYPYKGEPDNILEESKRQVFDIVALQLHEFLPNFDEQDDKNKQLTLSLIKESLESDSESLRKILTDVIDLPEDKREELASILEYTSLSNIIDTMTVIKNRLHFLSGLEQMIYHSEINENILERKHLHKILIKETWVFGDEYQYGVDDQTLANVLKTYLKDYLNREDYIEIMDSQPNDELQTIPDVCLWRQFSLGSAGKENLVIELKKPTVNAGLKEYTQILSYASKVANDTRFPKEKTRWKFFLLTRDIKADLEPQLRQKHRKYGHVSEGDNFDVYVLPWGHIISEAKTRLEYIKDKLNLTLQGNEEGLTYLRSKYKAYLPDEF